MLTTAPVNHVQPPRHLDAHAAGVATVNYLVQNNFVYLLDIKNVCETVKPDLYLYDRATLASVTVNFPQNPFSLWAASAMTANMLESFPGMIRWDAVRLTHWWSDHDYELRETDGTVVLRLEFWV